MDPFYWVAVRELKLRYNHPETMLFTIHPYCGNLSQVPEQQPRNVEARVQVASWEMGSFHTTSARFL